MAAAEMVEAVGGAAMVASVVSVVCDVLSTTLEVVLCSVSLVCL